MKTSKIALLLAAIASTSAFANIEYSTTRSTAVAVSDVNRVTTGTVAGREIKYSTQRDAVDLGGRPCGQGCSPVETRYAVDANFAVTDTLTKVNEKTTGTSVTDSTSCFSTLTAGSLSHSVGSRQTNVNTDLTTQKNNTTSIKGYEVSVSTINDRSHAGLGVGDDVVVKAGRDFLFDTAGNFDSNVRVPNPSDVSVVGFNDGKGDYAGVTVNTVITDLTQVDTSKVRSTSKSTTNSVFSEFN